MWLHCDRSKSRCRITRYINVHHLNSWWEKNKCIRPTSRKIDMVLYMIRIILWWYMKESLFRFVWCDYISPESLMRICNVKPLTSLIYRTLDRKFHTYIEHCANRRLAHPVWKMVKIWKYMYNIAVSTRWWRCLFTSLPLQRAQWGRD